MNIYSGNELVKQSILTLYHKHSLHNACMSKVHLSEQLETQVVLILKTLIVKLGGGFR